MGDITTGMVDAFKRGIRMLQQQRMSRLEGAVMVDSEVKERASYDQISQLEMQERFGRHTDTPLTDMPHFRRWVIPKDYELAIPLDKEDDIRLLNNPINKYTQAVVAASNRRKDDEIIAAFTAASVIGKEGTSTQAFDTANFQIAVGGAGLTPAKIREASRKLKAAENDKDDGENRWYLAMTARQEDDLLSDTTLTSSDFNTVKALVNGEINTWMGFTFIRTERLPISGNNRSCFAWSKKSMLLGMGAEFTTRIGERPDKSYLTQVYRSGTIGATRLDEEGVVEILCDES